MEREGLDVNVHVVATSATTGRYGSALAIPNTIDIYIQIFVQIVTAAAVDPVGRVTI